MVFGLLKILVICKTTHDYNFKIHLNNVIKVKHHFPKSCSYVIFRIFDQKIFGCYILHVINSLTCFTCSINNLIEINQQRSHVLHIHQYCQWWKAKTPP